MLEWLWRQSLGFALLWCYQIPIVGYDANTILIKGLWHYDIAAMLLKLILEIQTILDLVLTVFLFIFTCTLSSEKNWKPMIL